ncbi:MAG: 4-hydroxy-tetrahydrodipicolinate reductase [Clostridiales bacterium GWB2_37_7]|nr:MAG: 4-hydroxy-tetrahydrodipicolinate reductase [Clostridiales bacterium GWB2_37_7]
MINILMSGCNGKMGQVISKLAASFDNITIAAGISRQPDKYSNPYPVYTNYTDVKEKIDVVIDFSNPDVLTELLDFCKSRKTALVLATTGLSPDDYQKVAQTAELLPIFMSANMSLGINVLLELARTAAAKLSFGFDIEILEKHHNEKKDAPSGTALMIANEINQQLDHSMDFIYDRSQKREKRKNNEIGISAIRGGTIPGEHSVYFAGKDEIIEIKHTAMSRDVFGMGALKAAEYIVDKRKGIFDMKSMLKEMI